MNAKQPQLVQLRLTVSSSLTLEEEHRARIARADTLFSSSKEKPVEMVSQDKHLVRGTIFPTHRDSDIAPGH